MKLKVLIHPAEEGGFWAEAPALPGCVSEGDSLDETLDNIREAALGWLEVAAERTSPTAELTLPSAEASFRQGWQEATSGQTCPIAELWTDIDAE